MSIQDIRRCIRTFEFWERAFFRARDDPKEFASKYEAAQVITNWVNSYGLFIERTYTMAKAKVTPKLGKVDFKGFVNYVLSKEDKVTYTDWEVDDHDLFLLIAGDNQTGYKLGMSFNAQNDTFVATYMCNDSTSPNAGYMLSAFAPDWYNALKTLCFKHNVILGCVWKVDTLKDQQNWG